MKEVKERRCLNIASDDAEVMCDRRLFQNLAPETGKARLQRTGWTAVLQVGWSFCRDGRSATRVK